MSEKQQKMTGVQRFMLNGTMAIFFSCAREYAKLTEEEKAAYNKYVANRMFQKACDGKLDEPYGKEEMEFIKEHLN